MTLSFRARLTLRWLTAFGLVLAAANAAVYFGTRAFLVRDFDAQLRTLAGTELASAIDEPGGAVHLHEFPREETSGHEHADKFVQLIGTDGRVLLQSSSLGGSAPLISGATLADAMAGRAPVINVSVQDRPGRMIALVTDPPQRFVVAVGLFTNELDATLRRLLRLLLGVWIAALAITAVVGFTLASRALEPISRITRQASSIAEGHFAARLDEPKLDDEIGRMTTLLNRMLDRLHGVLEANRRFAADASHELRGPLTAMLGEIDVTLKRERTAEGYRDALTRIRERLQVMSQLTEDLMLLVRAQEGGAPAVAEVRVAEVLSRVVARNAEAAAASRISVTVDAPDDLVIYGDQGLLERVFDNLLRNAIQYNRDDGTVAVTARVSPASGTWVADQAVIQVRNSGAVIPAGERERVFDRFYRIDPSRSRRTGGAGLGLAMSREIVQLFKGAISVVDGGPGTTVEVRLPGGTAAL